MFCIRVYVLYSVPFIVIIYIYIYIYILSNTIYCLFLNIVFELSLLYFCFSSTKIFPFIFLKPFICNLHFLSTPIIPHSKNNARALSYISPMLWNSLPSYIKIAYNIQESYITIELRWQF